jgi:hypothetical protein
MINITWVLHTSDGQILHKEKIGRSGNDNYLCQDEGNYNLLEEITHVDIERFFPEEMDKIICELGDLKKSVKNYQDIEHIDEIIGLCRKCKECSNSQIVFNPFSTSESLQISQVL